ncbi:MAG: tyrosine-type recombinase/integrase [Hyphomicrobiales bacterium]|nr:tyrosine-type recombinase/integrase [Hyphomicrobiales bacterium]
MPLTDKQIQALRPTEGRVTKHSDGGGLQLWVTPSGARLWNLAYRFAGKQRKLAIGSYPTIPLKEARARRDHAKHQLDAGLDPSQQKRIAKLTAALQQANTFDALAAEFLDKKRGEGKADATLSKLKWLIGIAKPLLGLRPISEITAPEILQVLRRVEARERHESAKRLRGTIGSVFRYAIATGRAANDPTTALNGALISPVVRHRAAIIDPQGLGALLRAIDGHIGTPEVRLGLQLLALTFVRPGELRGARWSEVDFAKAVWTIPPERMKMRRPHRIPLARQTLNVLKDAQAVNPDAALILPGMRGRGRSLSENTFNAALRRLGYAKDDMSAHGFRSAASSILNESGFWNPDAIEAQLAHIERNVVRRAYARAEFWDERVRMMQWWADRLDQLRRGGEVISFSTDQGRARPSTSVK